MNNGASGDEVALLDAWRGGDPEAGQTLVTALFPMVYRFFASKLDRGIEDLAQQTLETCVASRERMPQHAGLRPWVISVARNHLLHELRRRSRHDARVDPIETTMQGALNSPSAVVAHAEHRHELLQSLRQIPIDFQTTLELYYWEDMNVAEIACALGVEPGTIRSRLFRARRLLERQLAALGTDTDGLAFEARMRARSPVAAR